MALSTPLIVDTDVGFDDFLAITYLLASGVNIAAFTLVNGISDVDEGAKALLLLQEYVGYDPIPIYKGRRHPMSGTDHFKRVWRHQATDIITAMKWGEPSQTIGTHDGVDFLIERLSDAANPASVLAIGPLTNIGWVLASSTPKGLSNLTIMGGAVGVQGNIPPANVAEGNVYVDPQAAQTILSYGAPNDPLNPLFVALNATSQVQITKEFIKSFCPSGKLGNVAKTILQQIEQIDLGPGQPAYDAWDPLAAVTLLDDAVLTGIAAMNCSVVQSGTDIGMMVQGDGPSNCRVATSANAARFYSDFTCAFG